jgi:hypothetical protein
VLEDTDGDGIIDSVDNCPLTPNADQSNLDNQGGGDVCDVCPNDDTDTCDTTMSGGGSVDAGGGDVSNSDGSVNITIPPGALDGPTSISITDSGNGSLFELTTNLGNGTALFQVNIQPEDTVFWVPITITFSWDDANNDGKIDGTNIQEDNVRITKDNVVVTDQCKVETGPLSVTGAECDTAANTFSFQVTSLSDFTLFVLNQPPVATTLDLTTPEETPLEITLTGSDPNGDPLAFSVVSGPSHGQLSGPALNFNPAVNYAAKNRPRFAAIADFNEDGTPDLAVSNTREQNVSILRGYGDGTFMGTWNFNPYGGGARGIAVGDYNGDGHLDLAVARESAQKVAVLFGDGTARFDTYVEIDIVAQDGGYSGPVSVITEDLDGDGALDLAVANTGSSEVAILFGDGTGSFSVPTYYPVGQQPEEFVIGDLNLDGILDLAVAAANCKCVSVLLGSGAGVFEPAATYYGATAYTTTDVEIGDFNNDGFPDLVATSVGGFLSFLPGDGTGTISYRTFILVGRSQYQVAVEDYDFDGNLDLAVTYGSGGGIGVLLGDGTGSFAPPVAFGAGSFPIFAVAGDLNMDGKPDLAVTNYFSNDVSILLNRSGEVLTYTPDADYNGFDSFTYTANDGEFDSNTAEVSIMVTPVNDAPVLGPIGNKTVNEEVQLQFTVSASDVDGDTLTISASELPEGATFDGATFSYKPSYEVSTNEADSFFDVAFVVSDDHGGTDIETVRITVVDVPGGTPAGTPVPVLMSWSPALLPLPSAVLAPSLLLASSSENRRSTMTSLRPLDSMEL